MGRRIAIDGKLLAVRRGIGNYIFNLIHELVPRLEGFSLFVFLPVGVSTDGLPEHENLFLCRLPNIPYPLWEQILIPYACWRFGIELLHCPANTAPVILGARLKLVLNIMDVMYFLPTSVLPKSPSLYQRIGREYLRRIVPLAARRAAKIITISTASRDDIVQYLGVPDDRVNVVLLAANSACRIISHISALEAVRAKYGLDRPFLLALGAVDPRKNTARIIEAYCRFRQQVSHIHQLAIVGLSANAQTMFLGLAKKLGIVNDVVFVEFVPEDDLVALYNAAEMLVYPSLYEGFGLPVLEAMACGTPVITSPSGSILEVAGDAAVMVNPLDVDEIAAGIASVTTNITLRRDLVAKGRTHAEKFSWQSVAEKTFEIYKNVMAGK